MTVLRIGYALLLLTVLGLDAFCGSILSAAATALLVLTPLACVPLHLRAAKKPCLRCASAWKTQVHCLYACSVCGCG